MRPLSTSSRWGAAAALVTAWTLGTAWPRLDASSPPRLQHPDAVAARELACRQEYEANPTWRTALQLSRRLYLRARVLPDGETAEQVRLYREALLLAEESVRLVDTERGYQASVNTVKSCRRELEDLGEGGP